MVRDRHDRDLPPLASSVAQPLKAGFDFVVRSHLYEQAVVKRERARDRIDSRDLFQTSIRHHP
jgi:hypothetical protein